jgi:hypothetical protein
LADIGLCSDCVRDQGLHLDAEQIGIVENSACPNCGSEVGKKLDRKLVKILSQRFFVRGTLIRCDYGAAPVVVFNEHQSTCIRLSPWLEADLHLIEDAIRVGFFYYGPRLWMVGEVEPLKALQRPSTKEPIIKRIITEYPSVVFPETEVFYRVRRNPAKPDDPGEYDSPPKVLPDSGHSGCRLDSPELPVMYGSQDLQIASMNVEPPQKTICMSPPWPPRRSFTFLILQSYCGKTYRSLRALTWQYICCSSLANIPTKSPEISLGRRRSWVTTALSILLISVFFEPAVPHSRQATEFRTVEFHNLRGEKKERSYAILLFLAGPWRNAF